MTLSLEAKECGAKLFVKFADNNNPIIYCQQAHIDKNEFYFLVRNEIGESGRGIGIEVYTINNLDKPILQQYALGSVLDGIVLNGKVKKIVLSDITGDRVPDLGIRVLNERSAGVFFFQYNDQINQFTPLQVEVKNGNKIEEWPMLISSIDFPVKIQNGSILVFYSAKKFQHFKFTAGKIRAVSH